MKTLVVPVDETAMSERAVPVAVGLAGATGAEVVLVLVDSARSAPGADLAYLDAALEDLPPGIAGRRLLALVDRDVDDAIVEVAAGEPEAVIVMATHARIGAAALLLGSVTDGVLRRASVPVVVVGPRCATSADDVGGAIVAAVDGSSLDGAVLEAACAWATASRARLVVLHRRTLVPLEGRSAPLGEDEVADRLAARARAAGADASARTVAAPSAAAGILDVATEVGAAAVVVGTRRRGRLGRALLGSTVDAVARRATCPVVVVGGPLDP